MYRVEATLSRHKGQPLIVIQHYDELPMYSDPVNAIAHYSDSTGTDYSREYVFRDGQWHPHHWEPASNTIRFSPVTVTKPDTEVSHVPANR